MGDLRVSCFECRLGIESSNMADHKIACEGRNTGLGVRRARNHCGHTCCSMSRKAHAG